MFTLQCCIVYTSSYALTQKIEVSSRELHLLELFKRRQTSHCSKCCCRLGIQAFPVRQYTLG